MYLYTVLILITLLTMIGMMGAIYIASFEKDKHGKRHPWRSLLFIPVIWIGIVFGDTSITNYDDIAKQSTEKWHTVYTNSINANVTVTADNITLNPKKPVTSGDKEKLFTASDLIPFNLSNRTVTITATNKHDSTSKEAKLTQENFIEKWPKGTTPDKSNGRITKIEYRSTPIALKWFGMNVEKKSYDEARITVEYEGTNEPSTKQLFGKN